MHRMQCFFFVLQDFEVTDLPIMMRNDSPRQFMHFGNIEKIAGNWLLWAAFIRFSHKKIEVFEGHQWNCCSMSSLKWNNKIIAHFRNHTHTHTQKIRKEKIINSRYQDRTNVLIKLNYSYIHYVVEKQRMNDVNWVDNRLIWSYGSDKILLS